MDTHILDALAKEQREGREGEATRLFQRIQEVCSVLVLSDAGKSEVMPRWRKAGYRLPHQQIEWIRRLDEARKLFSLTKSKKREIPARAKGFFRGHLKDDLHLYQAAMVTGCVVVTNDKRQLERRKEIFRQLGVEVFSLDEALGGG